MIVLSSKTVTARKAHACMECGAVAIRPGDEYLREACLHDGAVYTWVVCTDCRALTDVVWDWAGEPYDEGIGMDTYTEWAHEHVDDPKHGEQARAYLARRGHEPKEAPR